MVIYRLTLQVMQEKWQGEPIDQVQITALDPKPRQQQLSLFADNDIKRKQLNQAIDRINQRYGEFTVSPAPLLKRSKMPNVIAPAWWPGNHRDNIN